jgi:hypothetical protein
LSAWIALFQAGGESEQIYRARSGFTVSGGRVGYLWLRELQVQQVGPDFMLASDCLVDMMLGVGASPRSVLDLAGRACVCFDGGG